ncbi:MAG TPA: asparagine synthase (glutamine-hydrolyzing) [Blastocatellia bacterium]|nr:asparagine synthase (glutamine-hydrolyzing) [Blastocatellia bacterium]
MCGIAGIQLTASFFSDGGGPFKQGESKLQKVMDQMLMHVQHRGPDDRGVVIYRNPEAAISFGHTRLSIIDLSPSGHQPMCSDNQRYSLTYNGEIYNYKDIRQELNLKAETWRSHTDTEVLLRAYERWGVGCLQRLRGMFAFGIWDNQQQQLILARDLFGIKPLYYYATPEVFVFASEVRSLLAAGLTPKKLSLEGVTSYLQCGSVESPLTIVEGVRSLQPGHYLTVKLEEGRLQIDEVGYAPELFESALNTQVSDRWEAIDVLRARLEESVRLHLVSDVPLAAFLSGGIDSSAIIALMSRVAQERPKTFSVVFAEEEYDESSYAHIIAKQFRTDHHEVFLSEKDLLSTLPGALSAMDQPTIDGVNSYVISQAVKQAGITVALSGLGGDELFAGYPSFHRMRRLQKLKVIPQPFRKAAARMGQAVMGASVHHRKAWDLLANDATAKSSYTISRRLFSDEEILALLGKARSQSQPRGVAASLGEVDLSDPLNAISRYELQGYMANTLLRDTDQMSMAHSLEVRVPFVDSVVTPFVLGLPGKWKMDGPRPKPLLLDVLGGVLPEKIWRRPKMGFTLPFDRWLRSSLEPELDSILAQNGRLDHVGISEFASEIWQIFKRNPQRERWSRSWALYVLNRWCEINEVGL